MALVQGAFTNILQPGLAQIFNQAFINIPPFNPFEDPDEWLIGMPPSEGALERLRAFRNAQMSGNFQQRMALEHQLVTMSRFQLDQLRHAQTAAQQPFNIGLGRTASNGLSDILRAATAQAPSQQQPSGSIARAWLAGADRKNRKQRMDDLETAIKLTKSAVSCIKADLRAIEGEIERRYSDEPRRTPTP
ncbi:MAG: hypothetical protein GTO63_30075 [Anaerolineae bacterium]|nr:hypothetical protein [Anaerolineae bacterium]NIN98954.1 hypothetical protein [Anaerolineae bacterium]